MLDQRTASPTRIAILCAHLALGVAAVVVALAWRDPDTYLRIATALIGGGGLIGGFVLWSRTGIRWPLVAVDLWFVAYGVLLSGFDPCAGVLGQCDLPESEFAFAARIGRLLEPAALQLAVALVHVVAGIVGAIAVAQSRRREPEPETAPLDR